MKIIYKNWKHYIAEQDIVYCLGDVIFYNYPKLKDILDNLPGRKILLQGNHDRKSRLWYINNGFSYCCDAIVLDNLILSHKPIQNFPMEIDYNIHAHLHTNKIVEDWWNPTTHFLYSPEEQNWMPLKLDSIKHIMQERNRNAEVNNILFIGQTK